VLVISATENIGLGILQDEAVMTSFGFQDWRNQVQGGE
jgi:hypothetical protein